MSINLRHDTCMFLLFQCQNKYCEEKFTKNQLNNLSDCKKSVSLSKV